MKNKVIVLTGAEAKSKLKEGVDLIANATKVTLGAKGKNVLIQRTGMYPHISKDGVTVSRHVISSDPTVQSGVLVAQEASENTAKSVGDGTTTVLVLTQSLIDRGLKIMKMGYNSVEIKSGMEDAVKDVSEILNDLAKPIKENLKKLKQVAVVSANGDEEIGRVIAEVVVQTGVKGAVTVEKSISGKHEWEVVDGLQIPIGYFHGGFVNNGSKMRAELKDVAILVSNLPIRTAQQAVTIMDGAKRVNKELLILAKGIEGEALNVLLANKNKGNVSVSVAVLPEMAEQSDHMIEDICVTTGATVMSLREGTSIFHTDLFGRCEYVQSTEEYTILKGGAGSKEKIDKRIKELSELADETKVDYKKDYYLARLAALMGGVGVVKIWANSDVEIRELADRVDDAIHATKAAMEEGIVAGGGITLKHCKSLLLGGHKGLDARAGERVGYKLVIDCLDVPYQTILSNAGISYKKQWWRLSTDDQPYPIGTNVKENKLCDMISEGIVDPKKVTRICLENSVSVAAAFLTIETAIIQADETN